MTDRIDRRRFVWLCLGATASAGLVLTGCGDGQVAAEKVRTACPRGLVNDPYPGRCRQYVDKDGDGICDLSQPA